jgi:hypothetical protein
MKKVVCAAVVAAFSLVVGSVVSGQALTSGPQVGKAVPGSFQPVNITGKFAGQKHCLYSDNGTGPVAMIFAREVTPTLTTLIKKIDAATASNKKAGMGSFVVFLSDNENLADQLKALAEKENIKNTILSIDNPAGPQKYMVARDAAVTVVLYEDHTVRVNHAYRKGQLNATAVDRIVSELPKILER